MLPGDDNDAEIRVVHLPWDGVNPYQRLLSHSLASLGVESIMGCPHRFFFLSNLTRWRADVLHIHWPDAFIVNESLLITLFKTASFLSQIALARLCGAAVVWTAHDLCSHERHFPGIEDTAMRAFVRLCDEVIVHGPAAARAVASTYTSLAERSLPVIPHGSFEEAYPSHLSRDEARSQLGISRDEFTLLHFGQLRRYKGADDLVRAFKGIEGCGRLRLLIAGPARDGRYARELAADCAGVEEISFEAGLLTDERAATLFSACDAVVLPYNTGLTSGVAEMAIAFGRPCIATRTTGMSDAFGEQGAFFVEALSSESLVSSINSLRNAEDGGRNLPPRTGWEKVAGMTLEIYKRLLYKPRR